MSGRAVERETAATTRDVARSREPAIRPSAAQHVLALQQLVGNAAVARMVSVERQALQRACCSSCAAGRRCSDDCEGHEDEFERRQPPYTPARRLARAAVSANGATPPADAAAILPSSSDAATRRQEIRSREAPRHEVSGVVPRLLRRPAGYLSGRKESDRRTASLEGAIGRIASRPSTRVLQRLGDTSKIPGGLSCLVASSGVPAADESILFPNANAALTPPQRLQIENFIFNWEADGGTQRVRVDGFASSPGGDELNWRLSCQRAETVAAELEHPSSGGSGIPASMISVLMQGETTEFGSEPDNRRVTLSFASTPAPLPPTPTPTPIPTPTPRERSCGPDISSQLTDVLTEIQRAFNDPSLPEWKKELACDNLVTPTPAAIMAWDIIDLFLPHTAWLRSGACGVPRIDVEDPAGCGNTVEVDGKCHLAGTVNYAMYGIACKLCSDRHRRVLPAFLDQWSLADMRFWVAFYNVADTTGGGIDPPRDWATATYLGGPTGRPSGTSNRSSCPVGCTAAPAHSTFDFAWPPIRGSLSH